MTKFRPCIDLHGGKVKQIVGSSLSQNESALKTNFISTKPAEWYANLYKKDNLKGGHIIMLGGASTGSATACFATVDSATALTNDSATDNEAAAISALKAYPNGMQIGGGINSENAKKYLESGAAAVIVTSYIFPNAKFSLERLKEISKEVGKEKLVVDLSCYKSGKSENRGYRGSDSSWVVAMNKWQTMTDFYITPENLEIISEYCFEFLVHAAGVEGKQQGMDLELIEFLGKHSPLPVTYAGGANSINDFETCNTLSNGRVDLTIGSALDIFGGSLAYEVCKKYN